MTRVTDIGFHPEAAAESEQAYWWYSQSSEMAAADFLREVDRAIENICTNPATWPEYMHGTRRYVLRHFPFFVVYQYEEERIQVLAVAHGRRRPGYWSERATR